MITLYTGGMFSSKTKTLINEAERSALMKRNYKVFYPACCSNGNEKKIYSRSNMECKAVPINEIIDIYNFIDKRTQDIFIDEIQFLGNSEEGIEDLVQFMKYCEAKGINLYFAGLDLDYTGTPFKVTREVMAFADKVKKLSAICQMCHSPYARKSLRTKNGEPCKFNEELLIERNNQEYKYIPVCNSCFYKIYGV